MQVQTWKIGDVHPYGNNPRNNAAAVKPVANSIKEFGFQQPIVVDKDGVIIVGHTRYKAAKMLKLKEVPVVVAANLTPDQVKAYRVADNSTGEVAVWDIPLLNAEIQGLDYDFADFGLNVAVQQVDGDAEDDDYDMELPEEPTCRVGDIWQLGNHRLMVGDSTDPRYVNALMGREQADLLVTDPPYNVDYEGSNGKKIQNDSMDESQFRQFLLQAYCCAYDACRTGAAAYIFHADTEGEAFRAMFREAGWELHGCLIWVKNSLVLGRADYQYQHEPCLYGWKPGAGHYFINDRTNTTVIDDVKPEDLKKMKKEDLLACAEYQKMGLVDYNKYTITNVLQREVELPTINGLIVIVNDRGTSHVIEEGASEPKKKVTIYDCYLFGQGCFLEATPAVTTPDYTDYNPELGGGTDILYNTRSWILHPNGVSFLADNISGETPTDAEFTAKANWALRFEHQNVRIGKIEIRADKLGA